MWNRLEQRELKRVSRRISDYGAGQLPAPDQPAGTDLLPQIKHIVVLMMENHSYDNYLGMLPGRGEGFPLGPDGEPEVSNTGAQGESVPAHHLDSTVQVAETPSQSWHATHLQWADGKLDGFVTATQQLMPGQGPHPGHGLLDRARPAVLLRAGPDVPAGRPLVLLLPGPTFPNRRFLISGDRQRAHRRPADEHGRLPGARDHLRPAQQARHLVGELPPAGRGKTGLRSALRHRRRMLQRRLRSLRALNPTSLAQLGKDMQFTADIYPLGIGRYMRHVRGTEQFFADADQGTLPAVSIVDPDFKAYSEENPQDIQKGESFASEVIKRVMHGKGWASTLLIWLYDEHGGYYDHVPPPPAVEPDDVLGRSVLSRRTWLHAVMGVLAPGYVKNAQQLDAGPKHYDRYGFRVPAVLVSPYARPGYVTSQVFDHTSVLKLIEQKWNLPPLTARDAAADSPLDALDLDSPPAFAEPPELPEPALRWGSWPAEV